MVDPVLCAAEFSLIASIAACVHGSTILLETFFNHSDAKAILFCVCIWFHLLVRKLPGIKPSFKFLYWKYFVISLLLVDRDYGDPDYGLGFYGGVCCLLLSELIVFQYNIFDYSSSDDRQDFQEHRSPVLYWLNAGFSYFNRRNGIMELNLIAINDKIVINFLIGLVLGTIMNKLANYFALEYGLIVISFVLVYIMDFPVNIPPPFDIICIRICHSIVGFTGIYVGIFRQ